MPRCRTGGVVAGLDGRLHAHILQVTNPFSRGRCAAVVVATVVVIVVAVVVAGVPVVAVAPSSSP